MAKIIDRDKTGRTVLLTKVRASFAESLQEAKTPRRAEPGTLPTHGANFIVQTAKDFEENKRVIIEALKATCREAKKPETWWKTLFDDKPDNLCFKKGDRMKGDDGEIFDGYGGNLYVVAKGPKGGKSRPKVLDRHKREVEVKDINDVVYNGTECDVQIAFYYTDKGGTPRITCSVEAVRSHQEGERLGGGGTYVDADDFDTIEGEDDGFDMGGSSSGAPSSGSDDLLL